MSAPVLSSNSYATAVSVLAGFPEAASKVNNASLWLLASSSSLDPNINVTSPVQQADQADQNCVVWLEPPRIFLQGVTIVALILNVLASAVVFKVPVDVRGRHVAFLFSCVRILNVLDILQCFILLLGPIAMPPDCNPNRILCGLLGFLFTTTALFSPLVAIVMAVDRALAVYFHMIYKSNPYLKLKFSFLSFLFISNGAYLLLPCFTDFSEYVPVPWLALCFLEWGMKYRLYDLILSFYTATLILILIVANIAILVKIRTRKHQIKRINHPSSKVSTKEQKRSSKPASLRKRTGENIASPKSHHSAEDVIGVLGDKSSIFSGTSPPLTYRKKQLRPSSIKVDGDDGVNEFIDRPKPPISPLLGDAHCTLLTSENNQSSKFTVNGNKKPESLVVPLEMKPSLRSTSPKLCQSPRKKKHSPLVFPRGRLHSTTFNSLKKHNRSSSADDVLQQSVAQPLILNRFCFPKPLLRQVLDSSNKPNHNEESTLDVCRSSEETDFFPRNHSTSSFFSLVQSFSRGSSLKKGHVIRGKVSRITKMTIVICVVFIILYVPFLVRKLIQLIPESYTSIYIPRSVEIITLFGPFLSPLCNPIIYVFLSPHYKKSLKQFCKKVTKLFLPCCCKKILKNQQKKKQISQLSIKPPSFSPGEDKEMMEDVFLPSSPKNLNNDCARKGFILRRIRSNAA